MMSTKRSVRALHRLEGNVLRALNAAKNSAVILLREKSLGHDPEEKDVQARCVTNRTKSVSAECCSTHLKVRS